MLHICNMFNKLQRKWGVNGVQLFLILCTFAIGGSLCGYAGKKIMGLTGLEKSVAWFILYIIIISIIWPLCVLLISIPLGQFRFFKKYIHKVGNRIFGKKVSTPIIHIAIFASGTGTNAKKIMQHFKGRQDIVVSLVVCNKPGAGVLNIASEEGIPSLIIEKERFFKGDGYVKEIETAGIRFIVLAGFLWKLPATIVKAWPGAIINIHPALLPKYGGKGMYGQHVHEAVIAANEKESGISIHYVDELYDNGALIYQARCPVSADDTPKTLAKKIHALEHEHFPRVVEEAITKAKTPLK